MKKRFIFLTSLLLSATYLISCHAENAKVVETEMQTKECAVGKWVPETADSELHTLIFKAMETADSPTGVVQLEGGVIPDSGTWKYDSVGEVVITTPSSSSTFKLLNCEKGILDGLIIYVKK